jgi:hypothetical protein
VNGNAFVLTELARQRIGSGRGAFDDLMISVMAWSRWISLNREASASASSN